MLDVLNRPNRGSLIANLCVALASVLLMNALIFGFGWNIPSDQMRRVWFEPPDYVVGAVWVALFALMAFARWQLNGITTGQARRARFWITFLLVSCLLYPLYSLAIGSVIGGLIGNLWTIALAVFTISRVWRVSPVAAYCIAPVIVWVTFATFITLGELGYL